MNFYSWTTHKSSIEQYLGGTHEKRKSEKFHFATFFANGTNSFRDISPHLTPQAQLHIFLIDILILYSGVQSVFESDHSLSRSVRAKVTPWKFTYFSGLNRFFALAILANTWPHNLFINNHIPHYIRTSVNFNKIAFLKAGDIWLLRNLQKQNTLKITTTYLRYT